MARRALVFVVPFASSLALVVACSSSSGRPSAGSSGDFGGSGGNPPGVGGSSGHDGGDGSAEGGGLCGPLARLGPTVTEVLNNEAAPAPIGGTIAVGTYDLSAVDAYDPTAPMQALTGRTAQISLVVTATTIEKSALVTVADAGPPTETITGWSYQVAQPAMNTTETCPTAGAKGQFPFSVSGPNLALFIDATHRELYKKR